MIEVKNKLKNQITMNEFENEVQSININKTIANKKRETESREKMN